MIQLENDTFINPFSTRFWTPGAIPYQFWEKGDVTENGIDILIEQKIKYGSIMQIVGSHGSGKSTLLRTLSGRLERRHFEICVAVLNDRRGGLLPDFLPIRRDRRIFYMIDGFERLSFLGRSYLLFQNWSLTGGLLLTVHKPILGIRVLHRTTPRLELFIKLVRELTKTYSVTYSHSFEATELREIYDHSGGNFRTAFFELYDRVQTFQAKRNYLF
ncbi:MAG: ATP-binding cassette domain-containing protein [Planctomycetaceae bacterium]|jgi:energy-coupling factor transporter ATP-binding protein EcfA2|nr:ATP-binding cassette domain-containing protein [Planctomycetaceae bacterium]